MKTYLIASTAALAIAFVGCGASDPKMQISAGSAAGSSTNSLIDGIMDKQLCEIPSANDATQSESANCFQVSRSKKMTSFKLKKSDGGTAEVDTDSMVTRDYTFANGVISATAAPTENANAVQTDYRLKPYTGEVEVSARALVFVGLSQGSKKCFEVSMVMDKVETQAKLYCIVNFRTILTGRDPSVTESGVTDVSEARRELAKAREANDAAAIQRWQTYLDTGAFNANGDR